MKAFLVNIDVVVIAEDEDKAKKEAMRVAPDIHKGEVFTEKTRIQYVTEEQMCPNCGGVNLLIRYKHDASLRLKQPYECLSCKLVF